MPYLVLHRSAYLGSYDRPPNRKFVLRFNFQSLDLADDLIYIVLDTCVWKDLLKANLNERLNEFDEFMYWFESGKLVSITSRSLIEEWERIKNSDSVLNEVRAAHKRITHEDRYYADPSQSVDNDALTEQIRARISKIDFILKEKSLIAEHNNELLLAAAKRNLYIQPPNHRKDSFRDTVNMLSILEFLEANPKNPVYFTTVNHKDFSSITDPMKLHPHLDRVFSTAGLKYEYFNTEKRGENRMVNHILRKQLPKFIDVFKALDANEETSLRATAETPGFAPPGIEPNDYINNLRYLDIILEKPEPGPLEDSMLAWLFASHPNYRQYYFSKIGKNDLV